MHDFKARSYTLSSRGQSYSTARDKHPQPPSSLSEHTILTNRRSEEQGCVSQSVASPTSESPVGGQSTNLASPEPLIHNANYNENPKLDQIDHVTSIDTVSQVRRKVGVSIPLHSTSLVLSSSHELSIPMRFAHTVASTATRPVRLLVASVGNPSPYENTRHSAGHILLKSLQSCLSLPALSKSKSYGGYTSSGSEAGKPEWTLFQSPSLMNTSGVPVLKAYRNFLAEVAQEAKLSNTTIASGLIILHDEMETAASNFKLRRGATSAKGHNGIKSIQQSLQSAGVLEGLCSGDAAKGLAGNRFIKIAVGIGRPEGGSRDKDVVSAYVLGQLSQKERLGIESLAEGVVDALQTDIEDWK